MAVKENEKLLEQPFWNPESTRFTAVRSAYGL
jgi:hypothetical protein